MEAIYDKQVDIINKYIALSLEDNPDRLAAVDLKQEMNRNYHLFNHQLRAQFNWVGRYLAFGAFSTAGFLIGQYSLNAFGKNNWKLLLKAYCIYPLVGGLIGYGYARRFHSNYKDAVNNKHRLEEFKEKYSPEVTLAEKRLNEKLKSK